MINTRLSGSGADAPMGAAMLGRRPLPQPACIYRCRRDWLLPACKRSWLPRTGKAGSVDIGREG